MEQRYREAFDAALVPMLILARFMRISKAESYRGFTVGCAMLAVKKIDPEEDDLLYGIFLGANINRKNGTRAEGNRRCAEDIALEAATKAGFDRVIAIVVVGIPQRDEEDTLTLHPCGATCRPMFASSPLVPSDTIVYTSLPEGGAHEEHTVAELLARHQKPAAPAEEVERDPA